MFMIKYPQIEQKVFLKLIGKLILWHIECGVLSINTITWYLLELGPIFQAKVKPNLQE